MLVKYGDQDSVAKPKAGESPERRDVRGEPTCGCATIAPRAEHLLLRAAEAAAHCRVSLRKWRSMDAAGLIPRPVRLGSSVRWPLDELGRWIANGCPDRSTWEKIKGAARK